MKCLLMSSVIALALGSPLIAAEFEVQMLNKGEAGSMVFEPAFITAEIGDVINFTPIDKGHNVQSVKGMLPEGIEKFKSKVNKEFSLTLTQEGLYGIKCTPHFAMGMVFMVQAGEAVNYEDVMGVKLKGKAKKRFAPLFEQITQ